MNATVVLGSRMLGITRRIRLRAHASLEERLEIRERAWLDPPRHSAAGRFFVNQSLYPALGLTPWLLAMFRSPVGAMHSCLSPVSLRPLWPKYAAIAFTGPPPPRIEPPPRVSVPGRRTSGTHIPAYPLGPAASLQTYFSLEMPQGHYLPFQDTRHATCSKRRGRSAKVGPVSATI